MTKHFKSYFVEVFARCNVGTRFFKKGSLFLEIRRGFPPQQEQLKWKWR